MSRSEGKFGMYGGSYIPETLVPATEELEAKYNEMKHDVSFRSELDRYLREFAGRPTPLYLAENLSNEVGGARIYLKREDLCHGGAHKINNTIGQALLARRMGKSRIIAETGAGQHGVATAMACAALGMKALVYMGSRDTIRQRLNVYRMNLLGARVVPVESGSKTLKDAINEAIRDWITNVQNTYYLLGSAVGPHPYPTIVRDFQSVIGQEIQSQIGRLDCAVACVGGGSNAIGTFHPLAGTGVRLVGVEAAGSGLETGKHSAPLGAGRPGILHGMMSYLMQDDDGQVSQTHSISAGLDYPGVGPEHSYYHDAGIVEYQSATDEQVVEAFEWLCRTEGIIPALESSHALAAAIKIAPTMNADQSIVVTLSGRGDKDIDIVRGYRDGKSY